MKRSPLFVFICALLVVGLASPAPAFLGALAKFLLKHADEGADMGRVARAGHAIEEIAPQWRYAAEGLEGQRLVAAIDDVQTAINLGKVQMDMAQFRTLMQTNMAERVRWDDSVALASDLPNIKVRVPRMNGAADALRIFTQSRLRDVLTEPFAVDHLKIVTLGLADDAASSALERAAFQRTIPAARLDNVGFLSRLEQEPQLSRAEMLARLQPYEGKTVIVVGHVPDGTDDFIVNLANGANRRVAMKEWMDAAAEAGVNLIPIGCKSEKMGAIGTRGLQNSRHIRRSLRRMIEAEPKTIGQFLEALTNDELQIVIDPLEVRLVGNSFAIRHRRTDEIIGNMVVHGTRSARNIRFSDMNETVAENENPTTACLYQTSAALFDTCVATVRKVEYARKMEEARSCRDRNLKLIPNLIERADSQVFGLKWRSTLSALLLIFVTLVFSYMALVAGRARMDEQDKGASWRHIINRWRLRDARAVLSGRSDSIGIDDSGKRIFYLIAIISTTVGFFFYEYFAWYIWVLYALICMCFFGAGLEYGKRAFNQMSLVDLVIAGCTFAMMATAILHAVAIYSWRQNVVKRDELRQLLADTRANAVHPDGCSPLLVVEGTGELVPVSVAQSHS